jgi:hypothetical protein
MNVNQAFLDVIVSVITHLALTTVSVWMDFIWIPTIQLVMVSSTNSKFSIFSPNHISIKAKVNE